jgi:hypothetical protein
MVNVGPHPTETIILISIKGDQARRGGRVKITGTGMERKSIEDLEKKLRLRLLRNRLRVTKKLKSVGRLKPIGMYLLEN